MDDKTKMIFQKINKNVCDEIDKILSQLTSKQVNEMYGELIIKGGLEVVKMNLFRFIEMEYDDLSIQSTGEEWGFDFHLIKDNLLNGGVDIMVRLYNDNSKDGDIYYGRTIFKINDEWCMVEMDHPT